jgi:hypothetical protein
VRYAERAQDEAAIASARVSWARSGADYEDLASRARSAMPYLHRVGNLDQLDTNVAAATSKRREPDPVVLDFYEPEEVAALARAARAGALTAIPRGRPFPTPSTRSAVGPDAWTRQRRFRCRLAVRSDNTPAPLTWSGMLAPHPRWSMLGAPAAGISRGTGAAATLIRHTEGLRQGAVLLEAVAPEGALGGPLRETSLDAKIWSLYLDDGLAVHVTVYRAVALDELDDVDHDVPLTLQIEIETLHGTLFAALSPRQAWSLAEHLRDAAIAREAA